MVIRPAYKWKYNLTPISQDIKYIVIHHAQATRCTVADIHRWHQDNGWNGIGYNYFIAKDGQAYEGRGMNEGAHCLGYNEIGLGICLEGNFEKESISTAQYQSLIDCLKWLKSLFPKAKIIGHRDLNKTACPGKNIDLDKINRSVSVTYPILKSGAQNVHVKLLQQSLNEAGYSLIVDGNFGPLTDRAVRDYQAKKNLSVDGIVGPMTWGCLL